MLTEIKFAPGIDKQDTSVGATGRWTDSDLARFRYGLPEKIGGWSSLLTDTIVGVARAQYSFVDKDGNRYVAIGTDKFLLIYFEGQLYDITPFVDNNVGTLTTFASTISTDSTTEKTCTLTTTGAHLLSVGDMVILDTVTLPGGTGLNAADFEDKLFQVLTIPTDTTFTINSLNQATAVIATGGAVTVKPYIEVGPAEQTYGYGFGVGNFGGTTAADAASTLNSAAAAADVTLTLADSTSFTVPATGTAGAFLGRTGPASSTTNATLAAADTTIILQTGEATAFFETGTVVIFPTDGSNAEIVTYTGNTGTNLTGCTREQSNTTAQTSNPTETVVTQVITSAETSGELTTYTGNTDAAPGNLTTVVRALNGTVAQATWDSGTAVTQSTNWNGWGAAVNASTVTLEPGLWSFSNWGDVLVATISNGKTYTWDASSAARFTTRASRTTLSPGSTDIDTSEYWTATGTLTAANTLGGQSNEAVGNPTQSRLTLVSPTTRHLIHFGTQTSIGDTTSQDDMFIRFSNAEQINQYTPLATNAAGTQRLQDGTKIIGALIAKENILVWTNNALYTMKFVGAPFTFGFEQVGTNCGLIGKNAAIEIDGVAYWMSNNGFFAFDGTVNSLPCSVEDYVFDDVDTTKGQQICAGLNNLFTEVIWWYPSSGSTFNNRSVAYNYGEAKQPPLGTWYTNTNTNFNRTTWMDTLIYPQPYATSFDSTATGTFPSVIGETGLGQTTYYAHETGTDQVNPDGSTTALTSFIQSFSFSLQPNQSEVFLAMRRFLPNFKVLTGNNEVTVSVTDYPATEDVPSTYSPFTVTSSTQKIDTRARGRYANLKLSNTASGESWRFGTFQVDIQPDGRR